MKMIMASALSFMIGAYIIGAAERHAGKVKLLAAYQKHGRELRELERTLPLGHDILLIADCPNCHFKITNSATVTYGREISK